MKSRTEQISQLENVKWKVADGAKRKKNGERDKY